MSSLSPTWVHVTWGAGGSTQERSLELAGEAQGMGLESCLHLTCTNMGQEVLDSALTVSWETTLLRYKCGLGELMSEGVRGRRNWESLICWLFVEVSPTLYYG